MTVSWKFAVFEIVPLVPVTPSEKVWKGTEDETVIVIVVPVLDEAGAKLALIPVGQPGPCEKLTVPTKPFTGET